MTIIKADEKAVSEAAALLRAGQLVALPTETVYGLAADAADSRAVAQIFAVKNRPQFNPLIAHVCDIEMAADYVEICPLAQRLMKQFWPGPLSFVLPLKAGAAISPLVTAGLNTVAARCPKGIFGDIIRAVGRPLAAPSANISGKISPTTAAAVAAGIGDKIPLIVDGGTCAVGVESTIIKIAAGKIYLLRAGGLPREAIEKAAGATLEELAHDTAIEAPGQLKSHYAPEARVRLNAREVRQEEVLLAFGAKRVDGAEQARAVRNLSESGDLAEAAANLFLYLAELDKTAGAGGIIAVEPIPATGIGEAINDRLSRAAAERE